MNPRPLSNRKKVQFLIALTILAWATQVLMHQLARGEEAPAPPPEPVASERFVPGTARFAAGATLELRAEATITGTEVKLRQICRWADSDREVFAPLAELTIARLTGNAPFQAVTIDEIRQTLHDAGVNLAVVRFSGPTNCTVARGDIQYDEKTALQQWIDAREGKAPAATPGAAPATRPAPPAGAPQAAAAPAVAAKSAPVAESPVRSLRELLQADAAVRLSVPAEQLQITFNPADEKVLNLAEPQFKFNLEARRMFNLGDVSWDVLIVTETGTKKVPVAATARAWQRQLLLNRPLAFKQVIRAEDLTERRALVDRLPEEPLLTLSQALGQEAARELKPGTVLTSRMVDPVALAKSGQFITITLAQGNVRVKTVARAMEGGSFGQSIRVQNEATREIYEVVLTGPQEGTISPPTPERKVAAAAVTE
ncbi:MAG: flagella basal body P-ring formation protein FlgA [Phycisphaerales bacterium]|nr:flagella basal body P-ring formation protein FlgA [Phycisphaerales bacterium]